MRRKAPYKKRHIVFKCWVCGQLIYDVSHQKLFMIGDRKIHFHQYCWDDWYAGMSVRRRLEFLMSGASKYELFDMMWNNGVARQQFLNSIVAFGLGDMDEAKMRDALLGMFEDHTPLSRKWMIQYLIGCNIVKESDFDYLFEKWDKKEVIE